MSTIVIMPGGFHPFHAGHAALYNSAVKAFPGADVYVAATDDTSSRPFPFQIKEKLAQLAGVSKGRFMRVKSPFQAKEITAPYDPARDRLIFVRSEKDADKPPQAGGVKKDGSPSYLQPLAGQTNIRPFGEHAYMAYLPTVEFGPGMTSATEIRTAWPKLNDKRKTALVMSLYPATQKNPALAANVVKMLDTAMGTELAESNMLGSVMFKSKPTKFKKIQPAASRTKDFMKRDFSLKEFAPAGSGGGVPPRGPKTPGQDPWGGDDSGGDPYGQPKPRHYARSSSYFEQFEADHFDDEVFDKDTGTFKGYWDDEDGRIQIAYFKFDDPTQTGGDDPGMGWYYEPVDEGLDENQGWAATFTSEESGQMAGTPASTGMWAGYQRRENQPVDEDYLEEKWSAKYKRSINCNNPKGFSQRAHCAGRKK